MASRKIEPKQPETRSTGFLLTQVGSHAGYVFGVQVAELGITTAQIGFLLALASEDGMSQSALAKRLGVGAARAVVVVDDLERGGFVSRSDADRRTYSIRLTEAGRKGIESISKIARQHEENYFSSLSGEEKSHLRALLEKLAHGHHLSSESPACKPVVLMPVKRASAV